MISCRSGACRATTQNAARCGATDVAKGAFPPWFLMVKCPVGLLLQPAVAALACKCLYWENQVGSATSADLTQQRICAHRNRPPRPTAAQTALTFVVSPRLLLRILSLCRTYPAASTNEFSRPRPSAPACTFLHHGMLARLSRYEVCTPWRHRGDRCCAQRPQHLAEHKRPSSLVIYPAWCPSV